MPAARLSCFLPLLQITPCSLLGREVHLCPYQRCFLLIWCVPAHGGEGRYGQTSSPRSCCVGESGCWQWGCSFVLLQLEAGTHLGMLPGKYNCTVSRCFQSMALHLLLLGGAGRRTRKWCWKSMAKNGQDQVRSSHMADKLLAP